MEQVYRYPSRDLPQVYWHLQDCAARFGYELRWLASEPTPESARGASFEIVHKATQCNVGQVRVVENQYGALITVTDQLPKPEGGANASVAPVALQVDRLFACVALPPERRAKRWPR